jgi:hypothetical protein
VRNANSRIIAANAAEYPSVILAAKNIMARTSELSRADFQFHLLRTYSFGRQQIFRNTCITVFSWAAADAWQAFEMVVSWYPVILTVPINPFILRFP